MIDPKKLRETDPLKRMVEKQTQQEEFSPMNPPDPYAPPAMESIPYEALPAFLQQLVDEHRRCREELKAFEQVLHRLKEVGLRRDREVEQGLQRFFRFLDEHIVPHNTKEEKRLFPPLQECLLEAGEHSKGPSPTTAVDMLEDDHLKLMQLAAVTFNFLGLAARLPDPASQALTLDAAIEQGQAMVEVLRLHMFREENVVFPRAIEQLSAEEFRQMHKNPTNR